jgi:hypothetical protein
MPVADPFFAGRFCLGIRRKTDRAA